MAGELYYYSLANASKTAGKCQIPLRKARRESDLRLACSNVGAVEDKVEEVIKVMTRTEDSGVDR